jgi:hypothetical protein
MKRTIMTAVAALAIAAAAVSNVVAGTAAAGTATPARAESFRTDGWIVNQGALSLLGKAGLGQRQIEELFGARDTFLTGDGAGIGVGNAIRTVTFTSYAKLNAVLADGALPRGTRAVLYDNEHWPLTPVAEQQNPAKYEALAAAVVHAHHLLFVSTPATTLTDVLAPGAPDRYAAYLRLGLAASAARHADAVDIQAQGAEADLAKYVTFVRAAAAQARAANPRVLVFAGISTNPSGQRVTAAQFAAAVNAVRWYVSGFWLNIPAGGAACPRCGTPQPQVALPLLRSLLW